MPIINTLLLGNTTDVKIVNDPAFEWTRLELVPLTSFKTPTVFTAGSVDELYFDLNPAVDFSKYRYEFVFDVFGATRVNYTGTSSIAFKLYLLDSSEEVEHSLGSIYDSRSANNRTSDLSSPTFQMNYILTDSTGYTLRRCRGIRQGVYDDWSSWTTYLPDEKIPTSHFDQIRVELNHGNKYDIQTMGLICYYRAYRKLE